MEIITDKRVCICMVMQIFGQDFQNNFNSLQEQMLERQQKGIFPQSGYYYILYLGATANFFDNRLSLSLRIQDPFNWNKNSKSNFAPYYHSYNTSVTNSRFISFGIKLKFGKLELENKQASSGKKVEAVECKKNI